MKCFCFYALLFFLWFSAAYSQDFKGGFSAGLVASQVDGDFYSGYHKTGFLAGAFVNRPLSDEWKIQVELRYIQKGSYHKINPDVPGSDYYKLRLNYAEIPIVFQYSYKKKYVIDAGPAIGLLFASLEEGLNSGGQLITSRDNNFKRFEYSIQGGVMFMLHHHFSVAFRAGYSLAPIRGKLASLHLAMRGGQYNNLLTLVFYYHL